MKWKDADNAGASGLKSSPLRGWQHPFLPDICLLLLLGSKERVGPGKGDQEEEGCLWKLRMSKSE